MVQNKRIMALDLARGFSVLVMIMVHTLWMYGETATQTESLLGTILHFLGKGTVSFLMAMGIALVCSRQSSFWGLIKRGVSLLILAYTMNLFKFVIPIMLGVIPENFVAAYQWSFPLSSTQYFYLLSTGDILQLAGLALLLIAFLQPLLKTLYGSMALTIMTLLLSRIGSVSDIDYRASHYLLKLFWSQDYQVYFPVFPWISAIFLGIFCGHYFKLIHYNQQKLFTHFFVAGVLFLAVGGGLVLMNPAYHFADFFHLGPGGMVYLMGFNLIGLSLFYLLARQKLSHSLVQLLSYSSRHVTILYILQWVLICWGMGLVGYQQLSTGQVFIALPLVIIATFGSHYLFHQLVDFIRQQKDLFIIKITSS